MAARVDLFCEDAAHEACARALVMRLAAQEDAAVSVNVATSRFGIGRLRRELRAFQVVVRRSGGTPDLLLVLIDGNDQGMAVRRREVEQLIDSTLFPSVVIGVPEPQVERWLLADPPSFAERFGQQPLLGEDGVDWKRRLVEALEATGEIVTQGGADFADEIVGAMDLYRAGRAVPSLGMFIDDLRAALRRLP